MATEPEKSHSRPVESAPQPAGAERRWIDPHHARVLLLTFACLGAGLLLFSFRSDDAKSVHSIPGLATDEIPNVNAGVNVEKWILLDYLLMFLVALAIVNALFLPRLHLGSKGRIISSRLGGMSAEQRWIGVGLTATVVYLLADIVETSILWSVARDFANGRNVQEWLLRVMSDAHNLKWIALAIALIAVAARWSRRTPPLPGTHSIGAPTSTADRVSERVPTATTADEVGDSHADEDADDDPALTESPGADSASDWNAANHAPMGQIYFEPEENASQIEFAPEASGVGESAAMASGEDSTDEFDRPEAPSGATTSSAARADVAAHDTSTDENSTSEDPADTDPGQARTSADDWKPSKDRFGIAVSGGGIRSASFALGVLDVLRERKLLEQASYVTAVSGGSYAASALQHANRMGEDSRTQLVPRLRRRLNYLLPDSRTSFSGVVRVLLGLLLNLWILYLVIFMVARPVGWAIGSPLIQEGLRYDGPVVTDVITDEDDPDESDERWNRRTKDNEGGGCGLHVSPNTTPSIDPQSVRTGRVRLDERVVSTIEFKIHVTKQCVAIDRGDADDRAWTFDVLSTKGLIRIDDGVAEIIREPELTAIGAEPAHPCPCTPIDIAQIVDVTVPNIELTENALVADRRESLDVLLEPIAQVRFAPSSIVDLRGDLDWDLRHALVPGALGIAMVLAWMVSGLNAVIARPRLLRWVSATSRWAGWGFLAALAMFVALPWLVKVVPDRVAEGLVAGPTDGQTGALSWLPSSIQPILAWPVLAVATVIRFVQQQRSVTSASEKPNPSKKRNAAAFLSKVIVVLTRLAVGIVLVALVIATSIMMMTTAALNGPFGDNAWISREIFGFRIPWPQDLAVWAGVIILALAVRTAFAAGTWSLGPYYRRQLRWAFMGDATGYDAFDGSSLADHTAIADTASDVERKHAGYLDGTSAELVVCCAANVLGADRAPSGRRAVSFSASRSWIGGPELGWVSTPEYVGKMSPARRTDVTVSAMTALSGAAASPAMGKQSLGPLGSVLALLNVRLGGWLPHPKAVLNMGTAESAPTEQPNDGPTTWKHTPGWPYFVREVIRRHKQEAAYVYVSDGGHWENLGLVESIRRGCNTIIAISAAGDGASSHATLAEAVEIARTDLDVEIEFDDVWTMRPTAGGDPDATLPSGRQFLRQRGDDPEIGRVAPRGWTFGTFTRRGVPYPHDTGRILLIEATMVDRLALDVHAYAEGHAEFPDINTGDQFFANRDFESYRMLGATLAERALDDPPKGTRLAAQITAMPSPAR